MDNTTKKADEPADKLLGVELLRFASAIAVLIFHYQHFAFVGASQVNFSRSAQPFYSVLRLFYEYGFYGVQVFWCISGFIFFWKYGEQIARKSVSGYVFFVLRLSRLYPLHLITLLFIAVSQMLYFRIVGANFVYPYNDGYHFLLQLLMASNWGLQAGDSFNGPIWSISIEVLVYLLFFLSMRTLSAAPWVPAVVMLPALMIIGLKVSSYPFFYCILFFYVGCYAALAFRRAKTSSKINSLLTVLAVFCVVTMPILAMTNKVKPLDFLFVFSPALIFLCVRYVNPSGWIASLLTDAGNITYASYLLHVPVQITVCIVCAALDIAVPWRAGTLFAVYMIGMIYISHWCYRLYEMPMQRWVRRRLLSRAGKISSN